MTVSLFSLAHGSIAVHGRQSENSALRAVLRGVKKGKAAR